MKTKDGSAYDELFEAGSVEIFYTLAKQTELRLPGSGTNFKEFGEEWR